MAVIKHLANKKRAPSDAFAYLTCKFNESTHTPILDENKNMIPRDSYLIDAIEKPDFIERESECRAGAKFRASKLFMKSIKAGVMEICEREHLNQVDLLNRPDDRIPEREYRKKLLEQKKLDELNIRIINDDFTPAQTEFLTEKDRIRRTINRIIHRAESEEEFIKMLENEGIEITESRGRWGYKTASMKKPIRARQFGTIYEKEYILGKLGSIGDIRDYRGYYGRLKQDIKVQNAINAAQTMNYLVKNKIIGSKAFNEFPVGMAYSDYNRHIFRHPGQVQMSLSRSSQALPQFFRPASIMALKNVRDIS